MIGLLCIFTTSWCAAIVVVLTRYLKEIHFSIMMFHYGWTASFVLMVWLIFEFIVWNNSFTNGFRLFTYSLYQWLLLIVIAIFNALAMNLATIANQYEKASFVSLLMYALVVYAFIVDVAVFQTNFSIKEMLGAIIVLLFNLSAIFIKIRGQSDDKAT